MADFKINVIIDPSQAVRATSVVNRELRSVQGTANDVQRVLATAFTGFGIVRLAKEYQSLADTYTQLSNRVRISTENETELRDVTDELLQRANESRVSFQSIVELYARTAAATKNLGISQRELLQFVTSVSKAITLSGASSVEATAGLIQLSQGIASNTLRGDELRSVLEQLPAVADVIAKQMNITRGELRNFAKDGVITGQVILDAFANARKEIDEKFKTTIATVSQSFQRLSNAIIGYVGNLDRAVDISRIVASAIGFIQEHLDLFARTVIFVATILVEKLAIQALGFVLSQLKAIAVAAATNPFLAIAQAALLATGFIVAFGDQVKVSEDGLANLQDVAITAANAVGQILGPAFDAAYEALGRLFGFDAAPSIRELVIGVAGGMDRVIGTVRGTVYAVSDYWSSLWTVALPKFTIDGINFILDGIETLLDRIGAAIDTIQTLFYQSFTAIAQSVKALAQAAVDAASGLFESAEGNLNQASVSLQRSLSVFSPDNINRQYVKEFAEKSGQRTLPQIENTFTTAYNELGAKLQESFKEGFDQDTFLGFVTSIFDEAEQKARERQADLDRLNAAQAAQRKKNREADELKNRTIAAPGLPTTDTSKDTLEAILKPQKEYNQLIADLNKLYAEGKISLDQYNQAADEGLIKSLKNVQDFSAGFEQAFAEIRLEAQNWASVTYDTFNTVFSAGEDALVEFAQTGKVEFGQLADSIVSDLIRIYSRMLLVQALNLFLPSGSVPPIGFGGSRATGGDVQPGRSYIVGEKGRETFTPDRPGRITPAASDTGGKAVTNVVNVLDPKMIPAAMRSRDGEQTVLNIISTNAEFLKRVLS